MFMALRSNIPRPILATLLDLLIIKSGIDLLGFKFIN